jgi:hypothetical protein
MFWEAHPTGNGAKGKTTEDNKKTLVSKGINLLKLSEYIIAKFYFLYRTFNQDFKSQSIPRIIPQDCILIQKLACCQRFQVFPLGQLQPLFSWLHLHFSMRLLPVLSYLW